MFSSRLSLQNVNSLVFPLSLSSNYARNYLTYLLKGIRQMMFIISNMISIMISTMIPDQSDDRSDKKRIPAENLPE